MSFFDSPVGRCELVHELVLLDETQRECAHEHACPPGRQCPLAVYFTEFSGVSDPDSLPTRQARRRPRARAAAVRPAE